MFKKENWQTEKIIQALARIPAPQAHFLIWIAMLGGIVFLIGFFQAGATWQENLDKLPASWGLILLGLTCLTLFLPLPFIIYLAKELQKTKARIDELESRKA